jgi:hypothetical protein
MSIRTALAATAAAGLVTAGLVVGAQPAQALYPFGSIRNVGSTPVEVNYGPLIYPTQTSGSIDVDRVGLRGGQSGMKFWRSTSDGQIYQGCYYLGPDGVKALGGGAWAVRAVDGCLG